MGSAALVRIAIDVGGTFTDAVSFNEESGDVHLLKIQSTPRDPEAGLTTSLAKLITQAKILPPEVSSIVHVTTVASNLLLGQVDLDMPRCALVTTMGFRDIIEIGRQNRPETYNLFFERPKELVPRELRLEVDERVDSSGRVLTEVRQEELASLMKALKDLEVQTVAVSFLNSFANGANERMVKEALVWGGLLVHISSEVDPEHREYERTSTTVVNAILAPVVADYLRKAEKAMSKQKIQCHLEVLSSSGGRVDVVEAQRRPVSALESGPAAGVVGAAEIAKRLRLRKVVSFDMGGTTAKAGVVVNFTPLTVPETEVGGRVHMGRVVKGSGYPVRYPSVDLAEVSAGGGTIISVDQGGGLLVGPLSAGANPGPACYGKGGVEPTITDANLVLGRIGNSILGGEFRLDPQAARASLERVAGAAGMTYRQVAAAALKVVNVQMARAINIVSLERGMDPRQFVLIAFGGAGPMHAAELADQVGIRRIVVPPAPGLFSALGMLMTDARYNEVRGTFAILDAIEEKSVDATYEELEQALGRRIRMNGVVGKLTFVRSVDMRYYGQGYELEVGVRKPFSKANALTLFERKHKQVYGFLHQGERVEITAFRLVGRVGTEKLDLAKLRAKGIHPEATRRKVWFGDHWYEVTVCGRSEVEREGSIKGPAVVEEYDSTIVVPPGWRLRVSRLHSVLLEKAD